MADIIEKEDPVIRPGTAISQYYQDELKDVWDKYVSKNGQEPPLDKWSAIERKYRDMYISDMRKDFETASAKKGVPVNEDKWNTLLGDFQRPLTPNAIDTVKNGAMGALDLLTRGLDYAGGIGRTAVYTAAGATNQTDWDNALKGKAPTGKQYLARLGVNEKNTGHLSDLPYIGRIYGDDESLIKRGGMLDPSGAGALGFLSDVFMDPTTYFGGYFVKQGTKALSPLAKAFGAGAEMAAGSKFLPPVIKGGTEFAMNAGKAATEALPYVVGGDPVGAIGRMTGKSIYRRPFVELDNMARDFEKGDHAISDMMLEGRNNVPIRGDMRSMSNQLENWAKDLRQNVGRLENEARSVQEGVRKDNLARLESDRFASPINESILPNVNNVVQPAADFVEKVVRPSKSYGPGADPMLERLGYWLNKSTENAQKATNSTAANYPERTIFNAEHPGIDVLSADKTEVSKGIPQGAYKDSVSGSDIGTMFEKILAGNAKKEVERSANAAYEHALSNPSVFQKTDPKLNATPWGDQIAQQNSKLGNILTVLDAANKKSNLDEKKRLLTQVDGMLGGAGLMDVLNKGSPDPLGALLGKKIATIGAAPGFQTQVGSRLYGTLGDNVWGRMFGNSIKHGLVDPYKSYQPDPQPKDFMHSLVPYSNDRFGKYIKPKRKGD